MKKFKKVAVYMLIFCLILSTGSMFANTKAKAQSDELSDAEKYNFQLVEKNDDIVTVKAEYEGDELYATLDKNTSEVTMKAVEKPDNLFGIGNEIVTEFNVEVEEISADYETVSAIAIDKKSGKKIKLQKEKKNKKNNKVQAQLPALIPVAQWAGAGLLAWLASHAASITIAGITAYAISEVWDKMKDENYNYYTAYLDDDKTDVFIGPALKNKTAAITHIKTANTEKYNVFAKTKTLARELATDAGAKDTYVHHTNSQHGAGYYGHYHPVDKATWYSTYWGSKTPRKNHVWYK